MEQLQTNSTRTFFEHSYLGKDCCCVRPSIIHEIDFFFFVTIITQFRMSNPCITSGWKAISQWHQNVLSVTRPVDLFSGIVHVHIACSCSTSGVLISVFFSLSLSNYSRLQDWRCIWCRATVHTTCRSSYVSHCSLGPTRHATVPPTRLIKTQGRSIKTKSWNMEIKD